jgi:large subunit ribosomal protein L4
MEIALTVENDNQTNAQGIQISPKTFGRPFNEALIHQVITAYLANARSGTRAQKTRAEVRGGGAKPWNQKGTGRARAGTIRSPLWRGGGKVFAAKPQDYSQKINQKMYHGAMQSIFSELIRQDRLVVVDRFYIDQPKTKILLEKLNRLGLQEALIVTEDWDANLYLSARNLPKVQIRQAPFVDPVTLVKFSKVIITVGAIRKLEEVLG